MAVTGGDRGKAREECFAHRRHSEMFGDYHRFYKSWSSLTFFSLPPIKIKVISSILLKANFPISGALISFSILRDQLPQRLRSLLLWQLLTTWIQYAQRDAANW